MEECAVLEHILDCGSTVARGQELAEGLAVYSGNAGALHLALKSSNSELMGRRLTSHALRR